MIGLRGFVPELEGMVFWYVLECELSARVTLYAYPKIRHSNRCKLADLFEVLINLAQIYALDVGGARSLPTRY